MFGTLAAVGMAWSGLGVETTQAQQVNSMQSANTLMHEGQAFRVVQASDPAAAGWNLDAFQTATDSSSSAFGSQIAQVGHRHHVQSCGSCGTQCGGSCGSVGYGGVMACPTCDPYRYATVEALYMRREGIDNFTLARDFALDDPDFEWAPRITVGVVPDCVNGFEVGFTGVLNWESDVSDTTGNLVTLLQPGAGVSLDRFGAIGDEAESQRQIYDSRFWSVEMNRTMMAWDVAKLSIGGRYVDFVEELNYTSYNGIAPFDETETGILRNSAENRLIGLQVGADIFNPIGRFSSSYVRARAGGYLNLAESDIFISDANTRQVSGSNSSSEFSGLFEFGTGVRYQAGEIFAVRGGFEAWYLTGVATSEEQISSATVTPTFGRSLIADDDVFFIGLTFGAELKY
ncbi:hypothetical protein [Rhodopirellula halodulae]|uniref:hypothetical protein n=1 Tax=Rhodopirellula halodulae TaxID=2894198 RepID=UPI001E512CCA|nr:hypothetical protein [Rhodopirellula sp. JC737]